MTDDDDRAYDPTQDPSARRFAARKYGLEGAEVDAYLRHPRRHEIAGDLETWSLAHGVSIGSPLARGRLREMLAT